jgi:hypothetical protein
MITENYYLMLSVSAFVVFQPVGGEVAYFKSRIYMKTPLCLFYSKLLLHEDIK